MVFDIAEFGLGKPSSFKISWQAGVPDYVMWLGGLWCKMPRRETSPMIVLYILFGTVGRHLQYVACSQQRPVRTDLDNCGFDFTRRPIDDDGWVHRILWICAKTTQWAFGQDGGAATWRELQDKVEKWEQRRPDAFSPIYFQDRDPKVGRPFPEACYAADEHVTGNQFCTLAKILLTTHDPTVPCIGLKLKRAVASLRDTAMDLVRMLCGQGMHNDYVPAAFHACLAIRMCASFFDDSQEQSRLIDFVHATSRRSGWPAEKACETLFDEWGWDKP